MNVLSSVTSHMNRLLRVSLLTGCLGLSVVIGAVSCGGSPLLAPTGTVINLTVQSDAAALNSSVDIIAVLIENGQQSGGTGTGTAATGTSVTGAGTPVQNGTVVSFTTSIGTIEPAEAKTANGKVTVKLKTTGESGTATITAYSGGAKSTATIKVGAANAKTISVTATPQNLPATGGTSTVTARVDDSNGNGIAGVPVLFTTTKGTLSASSVNTGSAGTASTTLTTTTAADVTAAAGSLAGVKISVGVATRATVSVSGPSTTVSVSSPASFSVNVGTTVAVTNVTVNYGDGTPVASLGQISGTQTVQHFFSRDGIYNVSVSATDLDGVVSTAQTQVAVVRIAASVAVTVATGAGLPKIATGTVTLGTSSTNSVIDRYEWDFGDGTDVETSFGPTQTHNYTTAGTRIVRVRVVPSYGSSFEIVTQVIVVA